MTARLCRYAAALALIGAPVAASAQVAPLIPRGDLAGQERQRFLDPPGARAQPRGDVIALPSTVAPPGAENIKLVIRGVHITGMTVYSQEVLEPLYVDLLGQQ